jgi:hypothetical protein
MQVILMLLRFSSAEVTPSPDLNLFWNVPSKILPQPHEGLFSIDCASKAPQKQPPPTNWVESDALYCYFRRIFSTVFPEPT